MNKGKCNKCGFTYDFQTYGHTCPYCGWREMDSSNQRCEEDLSESQWRMIAPLSGPSIKATVYGPPPIDYLSYRKPWYKRPVIIFVIGVLFGGMIAWLFGECSNNSQSTVYGPPTVDSTQTVVPVNNE